MSLPPNERGTLLIPTYPDLAGKVAVVTGGSGGIGGATCRALAANGVKVAVHGRDEAKIRRIVEQIQTGGGQATGVVADVTDFAAIEPMGWQRNKHLAQLIFWWRLPGWARAPYSGCPNEYGRLARDD
jgi:hypothetical protein